jgi:hypothetical protein
MPGLYQAGSPYHDATAPNNRIVIQSDAPGKRICLGMASLNRCYSNCGGKHDPLSARETAAVMALL